MLQNETICLRVMDEADLKFIQQWHNDYEITKYTTLTSFVPRNIEEEKKWFEKKIADQTSRVFMIDHKEMGATVGFVSFSNLDYRNQKAFLSVVIGDPQFRGKGIASQSIKLIEELLRREFRIRKVTVQILSFNEKSLCLFQKNGYIEEGILKEEVYRDNDFYDLHLLSKFL